MDGKGANPALQLRNRDAFKTPNLSKAPAKVLTVSVAGPFKAQELYTTLQNSTRSVKKSTVKKAARKREQKVVHPLALAFREKSEEYRRYLYSTAVAKINKDLDALLNKLYQNNLQNAPSESATDGSGTSPPRPTVPAKYQCIVEKLYQPLSSYHYNLQRTKLSGEVERTRTSLHDRFQAFEENIQAETKQIKELQRKWEGIVADIFQLGMSCLGGSDIAALLSTVDANLSASSPASKAESTLFVPEHGDYDKKAKGKRKRVSFASPDMMALFPDFLFHTPENQEPIPAAPALPSEEAQHLEKEITALGKQHSADLRRLEHEHKSWWEKKQKQLAHTFMQD